MSSEHPTMILKTADNGGGGTEANLSFAVANYIAAHRGVCTYR